MKFKKSIPVLALVFGVCAAFATKQSVSTAHAGKHFDDPVYFQFTGSHGTEATVSNWQEISSSAYNDLDCDGDVAGCGIIQNSSTVSGSAPNRTPGSVPVDVNNKPLDGNSYTISAMNKN